MDNITLYDYQLVPKDYVCPICGHNFWDLDCPHSEWHIIQHFEKIVRMYADKKNWSPLDEHGMNSSEWLLEQEGWLRAEEALK